GLQYYFRQPPTSPIEAPPVRFVVSLQLVFLSQSYQIDMICFDSNNKAVAVCHANMDVMSDFGGMMADRARVAKATESETDLPVTPLTQQMLDFMKKSMSGNGGGGEQVVTGDLRTAFLNP